MEKSQRAPCRSLWWAMFLISFALRILSFVMPIYGKELARLRLRSADCFPRSRSCRLWCARSWSRVGSLGTPPFLLLGLGGYSRR